MFDYRGDYLKKNCYVAINMQKLTQTHMTNAIGDSYRQNLPSRFCLKTRVTACTNEMEVNGLYTFTQTHHK